MSISNNSIKRLIAILFCIEVGVTLLLMQISHSILISVISLGVLATWTIKYWILVDRKIDMDSVGITVRFLWYSKTYPWTQIRIVRSFECKNAFGYRIPYIKGIEISSKQISRPSWIKPLQYGLFYRPFSYIVLHFPPVTQPAVSYYPIYEVNPDTLYEFLRERNLKIN